MLQSLAQSSLLAQPSRLSPSAQTAVAADTAVAALTMWAYCPPDIYDRACVKRRWNERRDCHCCCDCIDAELRPHCILAHYNGAYEALFEDILKVSRQN